MAPHCVLMAPGSMRTTRMPKSASSTRSASERASRAYLVAWYHATKYALEALSDALRVELADFGIRVVLIEPGAIRTQWGAIAADHLEESSKGGAYEARAARTAAVMRRLYSSPVISAPHVVVRAMERAISAPRPRTRYLIGFGAKPVVALRALLPPRPFDWSVKPTSSGDDGPRSRPAVPPPPAQQSPTLVQCTPGTAQVTEPAPAGRASNDSRARETCPTGVLRRHDVRSSQKP